MRVGLDISQLAHIGGVATYTKNLAEGLSTNRDFETVYFYSSLRKPYLGDLPNVKKLKLPPSIFEPLFNDWRFIPIETFVGKIDVFHSSDWTQPPTKAKKVTTYHDVVPLKFPEWSDPKIIKVNKKRLELVKKEVDMIIAVSEATKKDLIEVSGISESRIKVIYEGVASQFKPQSAQDVQSFKQKYHLPDNFILAIGGVGKRRNLETVKKVVGQNTLIVTGETIPVLPYEELPLLYASASVLLYPSFYEGFGLPVLEAMACGTPVITSNVGALIEIGGDAVEYVTPTDEKAMEEKLNFILNDLDKRADMSKKGIARASFFTWQKCVDQTVEVYKSLMGGKV